MRQEHFSSYHAERWRRLLEHIEALDSGKKSIRDRDLSDFPSLYRAVCHHLAIARSRAYSNGLVDYLHDLVSRAHRHLYAPRRRFGSGVTGFVMHGFPSAVMRQWRFVALAALLFFGPMAALVAGIQAYPDLAYTVIDGDRASAMESMYDPENKERLGRERQSDSDVRMFGFYIRNNTGIGFRTFAGGMLFGIGTVFFLIFNGVYIGAIAGHLTAAGNGVPFWSFVAGHSAPELTAIALSGAAGLLLGGALVHPGRRTRRRALRDAAGEALPIVYGAAGLFFIAAFVEAFWSSIAWIAPEIKYMVGIGFWFVLLGYFLLLGRARAA